jgi:hypothetical protein
VSHDDQIAWLETRLDKLEKSLEDAKHRIGTLEGLQPARILERQLQLEARIRLEAVEKRVFGGIEERNPTMDQAPIGQVVVSDDFMRRIGEFFGADPTNPVEILRKLDAMAAEKQ